MLASLDSCNGTNSTPQASARAEMNIADPDRPITPSIVRRIGDEWWLVEISVNRFGICAARHSIHETSPQTDCRWTPSGGGLLQFRIDVQKKRRPHQSALSWG